MINSASRFNPARMPTPAVPVNAEQEEPKHHGTGETTGASAPAVAVDRNPERARLGKMVYALKHRDHGEVKLTRLPKDPASKAVTFYLALRSPSGDESRTPQAVYVTSQDEGHSDQSTIGYSDISLPAEMQGMGMSYMFHRALADAGELLGVDKVAIDNVVSSRLEAACNRMGMEFGDNEGSYNLSPEQLKKNCDAILAEKNWSSEPEQVSRTQLLPKSIGALDKLFAEPNRG
jgi:hypothetical protein